MDIKKMTLEELETRAAEIAVESAEADEETIETLNKELDEIEARKAEVKAEIETRKADMAAVIDGEGEEVEAQEEEERSMSNKEMRSSAEYKRAFGEYIKKGYDLDQVGEEFRALLTQNVENGTIAVPTGVQEKINTAWESDEIMKRVVRTFFRGNLKVGYEASASGAVVHTEGSGAVQPETLVINYVELIPQMLKKLVEVSDEVLANNEAMVDYLYDEIEYQIVKQAAARVIGEIVSSDLHETHKLAGASATTADIITAAGKLGGEATNPVIITTRATAAAIKAEALTANYGYDPFDGMEVLYTDATALDGATFIVGDLSGAQVNFPEGDGAKFKFDDLSKADDDMVRIIGRLYAGIAVVAKGKFVVALPSA